MAGVLELATCFYDVSYGETVLRCQSRREGTSHSPRGRVLAIAHGNWLTDIAHGDWLTDSAHGDWEPAICHTETGNLPYAIRGLGTLYCPGYSSLPGYAGYSSLPGYAGYSSPHAVWAGLSTPVRYGLGSPHPCGVNVSLLLAVLMFLRSSRCVTFSTFRRW